MKKKTKTPIETPEIKKKHNFPVYTYKLERDKKTHEKIISFPANTPMLLDFVENIINECKKTKIKKKQIQVGIVIMLPMKMLGKRVKSVLSGTATRVGYKKILHKK